MNEKKLREIMEKKGITAYRLSKISGVSKATISGILNGKRSDPGIKTVKAISIALEVDINEIISQ